MPEKLAEADVRGVDHSPYSTVAGYTRQPPRSTDPDFPQWRSFAPALFDRHNFFRIVLAVGSEWFRPCEKNSGTAKENRRQKETNGFVSRPIIHGLPFTFSAAP